MNPENRFNLEKIFKFDTKGCQQVCLKQVLLTYISTTCFQTLSYHSSHVSQIARRYSPETQPWCLFESPQKSWNILGVQ